MRLILVLLFVTSSLLAQQKVSMELPPIEINIPRTTLNSSTDQVVSDKYRLTKGKIWGLASVALGSFTWYAKERYEFQGRRFFEVKFGADPYGFWGSRSFEIVRERSFKYDFYHFANTGGKYLILGGGITIGISGAKNNKKKIHYLYDFLITGTTSVIFSIAGDKAMTLR